VAGRSVLYSFGVMLYEMLAGKPPFESQTPEGYLGQHLNSPPPPLDKARLPARTGSALGAIVLRALEKNRDRRFSSAREFAAALDRVDPAATASLLQTVPGRAKARRTARPVGRPGVRARRRGDRRRALHPEQARGAPPVPAALPTSPASAADGGANRVARRLRYRSPHRGAADPDARRALPRPADPRARDADRADAGTHGVAREGG
jgi:hypothetical protein